MRIITDNDYSYDKQKYLDCVDGELSKSKCNDPEHNIVDDECNIAKKNVTQALLTYSTQCEQYSI